MRPAMNGSASSTSSGRSMEELAAAAQLQHASGGYLPGGGTFPGGVVRGGGVAAATMMATHDSLSQLQGQVDEQRLAAQGPAGAIRQRELDNARLRAGLPGHGGHHMPPTGLHGGAFGGYVPGPGAARLPSDYGGGELHQLWKQDMLLREAAMMRGRGSRDLLHHIAAAEAAGSRGASVISGIGHAHGDGPSGRDNLAELYSMIRQGQADGLASSEQGRRRPADAAAVGRSTMYGHTLEVATKLPSEDRGGAKQNDGSTEVTDDAPPANKLVRKRRSDSCSSFDALLTVFGDELAQFDKEEKEKLANKSAAGKAVDESGGEKSEMKKIQKKGQKKREGNASSPDRGSPVRPAKKSRRSRDGNGAAASSPAAATPSGSPQEGRDGGSRRPSAGSTLFTVDVNKPPSRPPSNFSVGMHSTSVSDLGGSMHHMGGGMAGQYSHLHAGQGGSIDPAVASMMLANLRSREAAAAAREAAILHEMQARGAADLHHHYAHGHTGAAAALQYHQLLLQQQNHQLGEYGGLVVPPVLGGYHGGGGLYHIGAATYRGYPADAAPSLSVLHAPPDPSRPDPTRDWMLARLQSLGRRQREDEDAIAGGKSGRRDKLEVHLHAAEDEYEEEEESDPPEVQLQNFLDEFGDDAVKSRERFLKAVEDTEKSQADLHEWDRARGLRKCHSRTVVKTRGSRACLVAFLNGKAHPRKARPRVKKRK